MPPLYCSVCSHSSSLRCSRCLGALYCSVECQKKDWKTHCKRAENAKKILEQMIGSTAVEDVDASIEKVKKMADLGNSFAQLHVGSYFDAGLGVPIDKTMAASYYKKAADQGSTHAQTNLGVAYADGKGVPVDKAEAFKWYKRAAEKGVANAQCGLGRAFLNGEGVPVDKVEAIKWWKRSAEQGHANAQHNLGNAYTNGDGVPIDLLKSIYWYKRAADQGLILSQCILGQKYATGDGVSVDNVESIKWYTKAAEKGNEDSHRSFGKEAVENCMARAQFQLGNAYFIGQGVSVNREKAVKWLTLASKNGSKPAIILLRVITA